MGSVGPAAKAVGMGRASAYRLRERPGAESFAAAWDRAISMGRMRQYAYAMDRALNGVTIVRVLRGGAVAVSGGPDMAVVPGALCDETVPHFSDRKHVVWGKSGARRGVSRGGG